MRLLHVVPSFYPAHSYGGPIVSLHHLAHAQIGLGLDVRVLTSDANGTSGKRMDGLAGRWVTEHGVPTWYAPVTRPFFPFTHSHRWAPSDLSLEIAACLLPLLSWADWVHVTAVFSPTSMMALALATAMGHKVVLSPRGSLLPWAVEGRRHKELALSAMRPILRRVAGWHTTSAEEAQTLRDLRLCGENSQVAVVENGVDLAELRPASRPAEASTGGRPKIVVLGRLHPVKGIDLAIAALALLLRHHPDAMLVVAGPDPDGYGAILREIAAQHRVSTAVHFVGLVTGDNRAALLASSDQLWLCSRMESFGNVVIEALGAGTPVIAVHSTPWRWLDEAHMGRFVPSTAENVAAAALDLLREHSDPRRRQDFAERAALAVAKRFSWPEIARRMNALYREET